MSTTKRIFAVDPGTKCGWALRQPGGVMISGVWDLSGSRFEGAGMRFLRLRGYLDTVARQQPFDVIVFEEVRRHMGVDAAHIYGGIVAVLTSWCEEHKAPYLAIPVPTIKKHATGKGNANKDLMIAAAKARWPDIHLVDDNQADAMWIATVAAEECSLP